MRCHVILFGNNGVLGWAVVQQRSEQGRRKTGGEAQHITFEVTRSCTIHATMNSPEFDSASNPSVAAVATAGPLVLHVREFVRAMLSKQGAYLAL